MQKYYRQYGTARQNAWEMLITTSESSLPLRRSITVAFLFVLLPLARVGAAQGPQPGFEVASVRPNNSTGIRAALFQFLPGGRLVIRNLPLSTIVAAAYDLPFQSTRLTGGSEWERAASEKYDIEAVAPADAIAQGLPAKTREDKMRLMLRSLLEDRFKLKMRIEPKEQAVYALVTAKGGPKLQKAKLQESDCAETSALSSTQTACHDLSGGMGHGIHGDAVSIADVASFVQNWTDRPIVDKTGLTGLFSIQTEGWSAMRPALPGPGGQSRQDGESGIDDPNRQTLADALGQLGLKMESQRTVIDDYYVEHVERPSAN